MANNNTHQIVDFPDDPYCNSGYRETASGRVITTELLDESLPGETGEAAVLYERLPGQERRELARYSVDTVPPEYASDIARALLSKLVQAVSALDDLDSDSEDYELLATYLS